jgi:DNA topoisomerase-1
MPKALMLVENSRKAKALKVFLNRADEDNTWEVLSTFGNLFRMPKKRDPLDFDPQFEPRDKKILKGILKRVAESDAIYLGMDDDWSGEENASHLHRELAAHHPTLPMHRVRFNSLSPPVLLAAVSNPDFIDEDKVEAQLTRRMFDAVLKDFMEPLTKEHLGVSLTPGLVPLYILNVIAKREFNYRRMGPLKLQFVSGECRVDYRSDTFHTESEAEEFLASIKDVELAISTEKESREPPQPFTLATLLCEATDKLGISGDAVLSLLRQLYSDGLITYYVTDSISTSKEFSTAAYSYIKDLLGDSYIPDRQRFLDDSLGESIHPVSVDVSSSVIRDRLLQRLYQIIWARSVAAQAADAEVIRQDLYAAGMILGEGEVLEFDGFYRLLMSQPELQELPSPFELDSTDLVDGASPRFTESTLYAHLCKQHLFNPVSFPWAVHELIVDGLLRHSNGLLIPTLKGVLFLRFIRKYFKRLVSATYLRGLEERIFDVSSGEGRRVDILRKFHRELQFDAKQVDVIYSKALCEDVCPKCKRGLTVHFSDAAEPYLFCDDSVKRNKGCGFTSPLDVDLKGRPILFSFKELEGMCPNCGAQSNFKTAAGKQGFYMRCVNCGNSIKVNSHAEKDLSKVFS